VTDAAKLCMEVDRLRSDVVLAMDSLDAAADDNNRLRAQVEAAVPGWVRVEDGLPPLGAPVESRFRAPAEGYLPGYLPECFYSGRWKIDGGTELLITPTHWRLLPVKGEDAAAAFVAAVSEGER
jgi:hypothetical protein